MSFPKQLAALRKEKGFTQQILAEQARIHVSQLKRYEKGTSQPTLEVFRKIVLALNVSADMLIFDDHGDLMRTYDSTLRLYQSWRRKKKVL